MMKKGGDLELLAVEFLELIFKELNYTVVRKRIQNSGSQDGYDNLVEIVDDKYNSRLIYTECKDYTTTLNYTDAIIKIPQIATTHNKVDLVLFISPRKDFSNIFEETRNKPFFESLNNSNFRVAFLSPETQVHKYFSLYPSIYKKAYHTEVPTLDKNERGEILKQFDRFIFSSKNLQKIVIDERDKEKYIGNIEADHYHIKRSVRENQKREHESYIPNSRNKTILSAIKSNNVGVILLGNPGFGKTSELKTLAIKLWKLKNKINCIPTFKILKNFTTSSKIEDFLPDNFKLIPNQIIIFDGIDEIENIIDFSNKLRIFIADNLELFDENKFKFILSCRTNIYNKFIKEISTFDIYYLNEISVSNGLHFLKTKFNLNLENHKTFDIHKNRDILENPFYLELIGVFYKKNNKVLTNKGLLIEAFVNSRLNHDKLHKFSNDAEFDKDRIISYTQKIAFTLESMQKPFITASEIKRVTNVNESSLAKNSFLEENSFESWSFVLKNIQEYFVAKTLTELSFEEIISLLQIDSFTTKVHPTWSNVATFLLNLIGTNQTLYNNLIDWLVSNDFEILFNADSDRITEEIKSKVLDRLFTTQCIEDNLWINDAKGIASFSDCNRNIQYLISHLRDITMHRRARMSAIKLLSYMEVPELFFEELKTIIIDIITENNTDDENHIYLIQDAVMLTKSLNLNNDITFFNEIIRLLIDKDNREFISAITYAVPYQCVLENLDYFLEILDKSIGNKQWKTTPKTNSITSTKDKIFNLFTNIFDGDKLLEIYEFSIDRQKNYKFKDSFVKELLPHIKDFFKDKIEYHSKLIDLISNAVINDKASYYEDQLLLAIVKSCQFEKQVFYRVIDSIIGNSDRKHFLAEITTSFEFDIILKKYKQEILNDDFLNQFRNVLSHINFQLSKDFEAFIEANSSYIFIDKFSIEERNERTNFYREKEQKNFDVLFDTQELTNQIMILYDHLNKDDLNFTDVNKFYHKYYEDFELQKKVTENAKHLLYEIVRDYYPTDKKLNRHNVHDEILNSKLNIMIDILNNLPKEEKKTKIKISETQKDFIKKWCDDNTDLAKQYYRNHLSITDQYDYDKYYLFEAIYKFQKFFKFSLDEGLLLDMLWLNSREEAINVDYLFDIVSIERINNRVLKNLKEAKLNPRSFCNHLKFCVANNINFDTLNLDLKTVIYNFLDKNHIHYAEEIIKTFFKDDISFLAELLNYASPNNKVTTQYLYECIIIILTKENQQKIAIDFLIKNYADFIRKDVFTEKEIIRKLISLNYENAFDKFYDLIKNQIDTNTQGEFEFRNDDWKSFTNDLAIESLIKIFEVGLPIKNLENLFGSHYSPLRIASEAIINICKANNDSTCLKTLNLINIIDVAKLKKQNVDLFYLNKLKTDVEGIYYHHKSQPYKITEVLKILEDNKFLFIN